MNTLNSHQQPILPKGWIMSMPTQEMNWGNESYSPAVVIQKTNLPYNVLAKQRFLPANRMKKLATLTHSDFTAIDELIHHCKLAQRQQQRLVSVLRPGIPPTLSNPCANLLVSHKEKIVSLVKISSRLYKVAKSCEPLLRLGLKQVGIFCLGQVGLTWFINYLGLTRILHWIMCSNNGI